VGSLSLSGNHIRQLPPDVFEPMPQLKQAAGFDPSVVMMVFTIKHRGFIIDQIVLNHQNTGSSVRQRERQRDV
jgi:hypothetical protein